MRHFTALLFMALLTACAAPQFNATPLQNTNAPIVIIEHKETRAGFLESIKNWLNQHGYDYSTSPDGSMHDPEKITLEYEGHWGWDIALYLKNAEIKAYSDGQGVGEVTYKVPYTANLNKFSVASERISNMMDLLFGRISVQDANTKITSSKD